MESIKKNKSKLYCGWMCKSRDFFSRFFRFFWFFPLFFYIRDIQALSLELAVPKFYSYSLLKSNYVFEKYITIDIPKPIRSMMAMVRCRVVSLRLDTGRYKGETVEDRICSMCYLNEVETEKHFWMKCPCYNEQRNSLYMKIG